MKKFFIVSLIIITISALFYIINQFVQPLLSDTRKEQAQFEAQWLTIYGELSSLLNKSPLFEKSNLSIKPDPSKLDIIIDLKEIALDSPATMTFCKTITDKYMAMTNSLTEKSLQKLKGAKIDFRILPYQEFGPLYSWEYGELKQNEPVRQRINQEKNKKIATGFEDRKTKAEQLKKTRTAYGSLELGDSEATVKSKLEQECSDIVAGSCNIVIGSDLYILQPNFFHGKLYSIFIYSRGKSASYFNTIVRQSWQNLIDIISIQYNESLRISTTTFNGSYPKFLKMRPRHVEWSHVWKYETKEIWIGVGEGADDKEGTYYACLYITDKPTEELIEQEKISKDEKDKKESSEKF